MNYSFLPEKIKGELTELAEELPLSIARSNVSVDGNPGEGYIIAYDDKVFIFSRKLGENSYMKAAAEWPDVGSLTVEKDGINTLFHADLGGRQYSLKFSSFEDKNLQSLADVWDKRKSGEPHPSSDATIEKESDTAVTPDDSSLSLRAGLAAAMMYVSAVDDDISREEDYYIISLMHNNRSILSAGLAYYKSHSFDELLNALSILTKEQALCFLANMLETGMKDGVLHSSELELIRKFSDVMQITGEEYDTVKQVLIIKNKISVLNT